MIRSNKLHWINRLLGGRPMTYIGYAFTDVIIDQPVYYWRDSYGRVWLANNRWGLFRVRTKAID